MIDKFLLATRHLIINPNNQEKMPKNILGSYVSYNPNFKTEAVFLGYFCIQYSKKNSGYKPLKRQSCHRYQSETYHNAEP